MRKPTPRTILGTLLLGLAVAALGVTLLLAGLYRYGLTLVPEGARSSASPAPPPLVEAAIWARFGGSGEPHLRRMTPWSFVALRVCRLTAGTFRFTESRDTCLRFHSGISVASATSHEHIEALGPLSAVRHDLGEAATAAWMTRNRSAAEVLADLATSADWGHGWHGIDEAAGGFFGKTAADLSAAEAALLAAALADRESHSLATDPSCRPSEARQARDRVLRRMTLNTVLTERQLETALASPLGTQKRACSPEE